MRRPPFKMDGRGAQMRWVSADGRSRAMAGRASFLWFNFLEWRIIGSADQFEMRLSGPKHSPHPWHPIEATAAEAVEWLRANHVLSARRANSALRRRAARLREGRPVLGELELDEVFLAPVASARRRVR